MFHKGEIMEQDQYVKVNIKESTRTKLKDQARAKGMTLADYIEWLGANVSAAPDEADRLLDQLDESVPGTIVDMSDWVDGEAPACCIDTIANSFKPGHICQDWVRLEYTDKNGLRRQNWFNKRTGEYEFSERWKKIKSEYEYQ